MKMRSWRVPKCLAIRSEYSNSSPFSASTASKPMENVQALLPLLGQ